MVLIKYFGRLPWRRFRLRPFRARNAALSPCFFIIPGGEDPPRAPQPEPEAPAGRTRRRPAPEGPARAPQAPKFFTKVKGRSPLRGLRPRIHPQDRLLIAGGAVPPRVPQPVPEAQGGRTRTRPVPEVPALQEFSLRERSVAPGVVSIGKALR